MLIYERDALDVRQLHRIDKDDKYFRRLSKAWSDALRNSVEKIEEFQA
jgi:putative proteasome-type protease